MSRSSPIKKARPRFYLERRPYVRRRLKHLQCAQIRAYLSELGTARALAVWLAFESGEHSVITSLSYTSGDLDGWEWQGGLDLVRRNYAATKLLRKYAGLRLDVDKAAVALEKTRACERRNAETNARLREDVYWQCQPSYYQDLTLRVRRELFRILGSCPQSLPFDEIAFTSGSTVGRSRDNSSHLHKYQHSLVCTGGGLGYAMRAVNSSPHWAALLLGAAGPASCLPAAFTISDTEEIFTVPKDAQTDRTCARFHALTVAQQRIAAQHIIRRLKAHGVDTTDQAPNQCLAWWGSLTGSLATLDLSNASDLVSRNLVKLLFAPVQLGREVRDDLVDFETRYLARLRATSLAWPDGTVTRAERYSAMGCGFTFELMTLILVAVMRAVGSRACNAFGDDLVVESRYAHDVVDALTHYGLMVNNQKSFTSCTPGFRESCGEDYYKGQTVRVPHLDDEATSLSVLVAFQNRIAETAVRFGWQGMCDHMRTRIKNFYAREGLVVPLGPFDYGDGHLAVPFDVCLPRIASTVPRYAGWDGYLSRTFVQTTQSALTYDQDGNLVFREDDLEVRSRSREVIGIVPDALLVYSLARFAPGSERSLEDFRRRLFPSKHVGVLDGCPSVVPREKCVDLVWLEA